MTVVSHLTNRNKHENVTNQSEHARNVTCAKREKTDNRVSSAGKHAPSGKARNQTIIAKHRKTENGVFVSDWLKEKQFVCLF